MNSTPKVDLTFKCICGWQGPYSMTVPARFDKYRPTAGGCPECLEILWEETVNTPEDAERYEPDYDDFNGTLEPVPPQPRRDHDIFKGNLACKHNGGTRLRYGHSRVWTICKLCNVPLDYLDG